MPTDVVMPQMGESIFEGTITKWLKKPGDKVERDEPLFEISTDKVDAEIPSPASGILKEIKAADGETVQINTVVAVIDEAGSASTPAPAPTAPAPPAAAPQPPPTAASEAPAPAPSPSAPSDSGPATEVIMPQMGESIFEGTITKWLKKPGDKVERDEPLFEISTDKVDAEIPSPAAGVLTEIKAEAGTTVQINSVVALIGGTAGGTAGAPAAAVSAPVPAAPAPRPAAEPDGTSIPEAPATGAENVRSSPLVRKIAKDNNVDLTQVPGSGAGGRITKEDVLAYLEKPAAKPTPRCPSRARFRAARRSQPRRPLQPQPKHPPLPSHSPASSFP